MSVQELLHLANTHYEQQDWRSAYDLYRQAIKLDPVAARNYPGLAQLQQIAGARDDFWDEESWLKFIAPARFGAPAAEIDVTADRWTFPAPAETAFASNWRKPELLPPLTDSFPLEEFRRSFQAHADRSDFLVTAAEVHADFFRDDSKFPRPLLEWPQSKFWLLKLAFLYVREGRFADAQHCLDQLERYPEPAADTSAFTFPKQLRGIAAFLRAVCLCQLSDATADTSSAAATTKDVDTTNAAAASVTASSKLKDLFQTAWDVAPLLAAELADALTGDYRSLAQKFGVEVEAAESMAREAAASKLAAWNQARADRTGKKAIARSLAQAFTVKPEEIPASNEGETLAGCLAFMERDKQAQFIELLDKLDQASLKQKPRTVHTKIAKAFNDLPRPYCLSPQTSELYRFLIRLFLRESRFVEAEAAAVELSHCPWGAWIGEFWLALGFSEFLRGNERGALAHFVQADRLDSTLVRISRYADQLPENLVLNTHKLLLDNGYGDFTWEDGIEEERAWFNEEYPADSIPDLLG